MHDIKTVNEVLHFVRSHQGVDFINLWFTDVTGQLKSFSICPRELEGALEDGMGFDGSSVDGFVQIQESDLIAKPIPSTFILLPQREKVAGMFCEILNPDGSRFDGDSFHVLERQLEIMKNNFGFDRFCVGPELEFFLFEKAKHPAHMQCPIPLDRGDYFGTASDAGVDVRRDIILACEKAGIHVEYSHHEVAPSQHEIDFRYTDALTMARNATFYRKLAKDIADQHGYYLTFMPKPLYGENGNGMHVHQSLFKDNKNVFFDAEDPQHLSEIARNYIAGILKHGPEIAAVTNQWVNSYQRLVPGYEAPTELLWARRNRSCAIRVPMYKPGNEMATRIEARFPDPACNFPLAFAVMLAAGMKGIEEVYQLHDAVEENVFELSEGDRSLLCAESMPETLNTASYLLRGSPLVKEVLGERIHSSLFSIQEKAFGEYLLEATGREREEHRVTTHEIKTLLPIL